MSFSMEPGMSADFRFSRVDQSNSSGPLEVQRSDAGRDSDTKDALSQNYSIASIPRASPIMAPPHKPHDSQASRVPSPDLTSFKIQKQTPSPAGSLYSVDSHVSKASQRSWENDDEFDQVLKIIARDLTIHIDLLKGACPLISLTSKGRDRRKKLREIAEELSHFLEIVNASTGMCPPGDLESTYVDGPTPKHLEVRATCYSELLEIQQAILEDLGHVKRAVVTKSFDNDRIEQIKKKFMDYHVQLTTLEAQLAPVEMDNTCPRPGNTGASRGTYTCTYHGCAQRFETPTLLQKHKREGHRPGQSHDSHSLGGLPAAQNKCERINPSTGKPCNTIFSRPYDLTRHEDTIHNARAHRFQCNACIEKKTFSSADALKRHYRVCHVDLYP